MVIVNLKEMHRDMEHNRRALHDMGNLNTADIIGDNDDFELGELEAEDMDFD